MTVERTWLSTAAAAARLELNGETLRRWRRKGQLTEGIHWRHSPVGNEAFVQWNPEAIQQLIAGEEVNEAPCPTDVRH